MESFMKDEFGVYFSEHRLGNELFIYECGYEKCMANKPFEYKPIDYYVIHYCISGQGILRIHSEEKKISAGDIFVIPPFTPNNYYPDINNPWNYRWIGINGTLAKEMLEDCGFTKTNFVLHYDLDDNILLCFEKIYECCVADKYLEAMAHLYFYFSIMTGKILNAYRKKLTSGEIYFNEILDYIHANYFNPISINQISSDRNIDRTYIFKLFKKYLNTSPQQYILNYRLDKACFLLRKSKLGITDIAYAVGFHTGNYFSKQFLLHKGITPSAYKKQSF